jgi:hypothetical protein
LEPCRKLRDKSVNKTNNLSKNNKITTGTSKGSALGATEAHTIGNKGNKCKEITHFDSGSKKGTEEGGMLGSSSAYGCAALSRLPCKTFIFLRKRRHILLSMTFIFLK